MMGTVYCGSNPAGGRACLSDRHARELNVRMSDVGKNQKRELPDG